MGYFNPSTINTTLYNIVLDKKIADDVYKVQRPASVDDKVTSFIVVNNNTRIVSNTESGPYGHFGKGETMATVTLFVRALPGNVYPSVMDALSEKMVELFPQKTVQLHFEIFNVLPPMFDGVGFYYMSVLLNVDISKDYLHEKREKKQWRRIGRYALNN